MAKFTITIEVDENGQVNIQNGPALSAAANFLTVGTGRGDVTATRLGTSFAITQAAGGGGNGPIGSGGNGPVGSGGNGPIGSGGGGNGPIGSIRRFAPVGGSLFRIASGGGGNGPIGSGGPTDPPGGNGPIGSGNEPELGAFVMQRQQQSEWCWAAVALAIEKYFDPASSLTQCRIANLVVGSRMCCGNDTQSKPCNIPEQELVALTRINRLRAGLARALRFDEVQAEIDASRPVCARIAWASGRGHFVALTGYRVLPSGARHIFVADPLNPSCEVDFDEFTEAYHGDGVWTDSCLVQA